MTDNRQKPASATVVKAMAVTTAIGAELAITTVAGFYLGKLLDNYFGTSPFIMLAGVLLGLATGIWGIVAFIAPFLKE